MRELTRRILDPSTCCSRWRGTRSRRLGACWRASACRTRRCASRDPRRHANLRRGGARHPKNARRVQSRPQRSGPPGQAGSGDRAATRSRNDRDPLPRTKNTRADRRPGVGKPLSPRGSPQRIVNDEVPRRSRGSAWGARPRRHGRRHEYRVSSRTPQVVIDEVTDHAMT